ncbi:TIGR04076 family protein [Bacteroidota bacterium]
MERRKFIKATAIGSTCALAGTVAAAGAHSGEKVADFVTKITVVKKSVNQEFNKEIRGQEGSVCDVFSEGQEFIVKSPWEVPEGFCQWAWADIRTYIHLVNEGNFGNTVACCTDGFRPVFFKIERVKK